MIARLSGEVVELRLTDLVIDVAGVGYEIRVAPEIISRMKVGDRVNLFTALVVREDSWTLYGFNNESARDLFDELQTVTGVGPKVAHSLLAVFAPEELRNLIGSGDNSALEQVPGIGKKVASRIILELRERFNTGLNKTKQSGKWRESLHQALTSLGYSSKEADKAIDSTLNGLEVNPEELELSELLRRALSNTRSSK